MAEVELEAYRSEITGWRSFRGPSTQQPPQDVRNPMKQPYPPDSFWNMPIGQDAELVPLGFNYLGDSATQNSRITVAEENILCLDPDAPKAYIMEHDAGWTGAIRCDSRTGRILTGNGSVNPMPMLPIPPGFVTQPYIGQRPNMSGALVYREGNDIKLFETQPFHICSDGVAVSQSVNISYVGDSIYYGGHGPLVPAGPINGTGGSHGGSRMTAFGGTIRLGELVPGGVIPHAMKLTIDTGWYCSSALDPSSPTPGTAQGHRWPALVADSGWPSNYGSLAANAGITVPTSAKMGMLLTTNNSFDPETLATEPARILARAFKNYGAYVVDGDFAASTPHICQWQIERSNEGAFTTEFANAWGYEFFHQPSLHGTPSAAQMQFRADVGQLMEAACIVADNAHNNVGGAGPRRAPLALPLEIPL